MNLKELEDSIEHYGKDILSFCQYLTRDDAEAEDLCQDTFITALQSGTRIASEEHAKAYFLSTAVNLWKNRKRKFAWRQRITFEKILPIVRQEPIQAPGDIDRQSELDLIRQAVHMLDEKKKIVVLLYYMEQLREKEIAEVLAIPEGTVKSRLSAARKELGKQLAPYINGIDE